MEDIVSFGEVSLKDTEILGKKATYLAELYNKKFPVPPGLIITGELFVKYVELTGLKDLIGNTLNTDNDDGLKARTIQKAIMNSMFPNDLAKFLYDNYMSLNIDSSNTNSLVQSQQEPYVAMKVSSSSDELEDAFFLNIKGQERFLNAIKACWASVFSEKNLKFKRFKPNIVVQKMVNSKKAGYIYTSNPKTNNPNELVIEVCSGLGNALSMKTINASQYVLNKEEFDVISSELVEQLVQYSLDFSQEKTVKLNLDEPIRNIMDEFIIKELGKFGKKVEMRFNRPQKVLFAIDKQIHIVGTNDLIIDKIIDDGIKSSEYVQEETVQQHMTEPVQEMTQPFEQPMPQQEEIPQQPQQEYVQAKPQSQDDFSDFNEQEANDFIEQDSMNDYVQQEESNTPSTDAQANIHTDDFDDSEFFDQPNNNKQEEHIQENPQEYSQQELYDSEQHDDEQHEEKIEIKEYDKVIEESDDTLDLYDEVFTEDGDEKTTSPPQENSTPQNTQQTLTQESDNSMQEKESFMNQYVNNKPEIAYQKAISFNSSMLVIACDMTILSALKNKYKSVFSKEAHNYFTEIINELKMHVNIPFESEIKKIHELRDGFMNNYQELSPNDVSFILDFTRKFLQEF
jgi:hypothetical protein